MPFPRPTLEQLRDRILGDIDANLPGADSRLPRSILNVLGIVLAGAVHLLYGFIEFASVQLFADTAETDFLDRWSAFYGLERIEAQFADGPVQFTGIDTTVIPQGTEVQRSDGALFTTDDDVTIAGSIADINVTASEAGAASNTADATTLTIVSPISGVDSDVTVTTDAEHPDGIDGGVDEETDDALRERVLLFVRTPPQGGAVTDYIQWALEVPGVTRVFVRPLNRGLGTVDVFFVRDGDDAGTGSDIIPDSSDVEDVQDAVDERKPVTADAQVLAPIALDLDITTKLAPNTTTVQAAVEAEITDMLVRFAEPGDDEGLGTIFLSQINEAISAAEGEEAHEVTLVQGGAPADVVPGVSEIVVRGTITFEGF